jgi:hypothetical protein
VYLYMRLPIGLAWLVWLSGFLVLTRLKQLLLEEQLCGLLQMVLGTPRLVIFFRSRAPRLKS